MALSLLSDSFGAVAKLSLLASPSMTACRSAEVGIGFLQMDFLLGCSVFAIIAAIAESPWLLVQRWYKKRWAEV